MASKVAIKNKKDSHYSKMGLAIKGIAGQIPDNPTGLYDHRVIIQSSNAKIDNNELDCEFYIPFDDDTEANEAEIVVYNLANKTINALQENNKITVTAGYGKDMGVIFSGYISKKKTAFEDADKVTTIWAIDSADRKEKDIESLSFGAGTKASTILKKLVKKLNMTIAVFKTTRNYTYKDNVTVDGGLMENIKKYAKICKVSAYICKNKVYVCPLDYQTDTVFKLSHNTGLLSITEFEQTETNEEYKDTIKGYECTMLLAHQIQTGSVVQINTEDVKGTYRVREGTHEYSGEEFITIVKAIAM